MSKKNGEIKLELMQRFQADYKDSDPNLNCCKWLAKSNQLATAGDDMVVKVYSFQKSGKSFDLKKPMKEDFKLRNGHTQNIETIDCTPDASMFVTTASDWIATFFDVN